MSVVATCKISAKFFDTSCRTNKWKRHL